MKWIQDTYRSSNFTTLSISSEGTHIHEGVSEFPHSLAGLLGLPANNLHTPLVWKYDSPLAHNIRINLSMNNKAADLKFVRKFVLGLVHETPWSYISVFCELFYNWSLPESLMLLLFQRKHWWLGHEKSFNRKIHLLRIPLVWWS
jgi:hypothetical protein